MKWTQLEMGKCLKTILQPERIVKSKAKSAKEWTGDETSLLIDMLEANPYLWDIYHTDYSKRDLKEIAYTEIATSFGYKYHLN